MDRVEVVPALPDRDDLARRDIGDEDRFRCVAAASARRCENVAKAVVVDTSGCAAAVMFVVLPPVGKCLLPKRRHLEYDIAGSGRVSVDDEIDALGHVPCRVTGVRARNELSPVQPIVGGFRRVWVCRHDSSTNVPGQSPPQRVVWTECINELLRVEREW